MSRSLNKLFLLRLVNLTVSESILHHLCLFCLQPECLSELIFFSLFLWDLILPQLFIVTVFSNYTRIFYIEAHSFLHFLPSFKGLMWSLYGWALIHPMLSQLFKAIKNYCLMLTPRDFARKNNLLTAFPVGPTVFVFEDLSTTYSITGEFRIIELSHDESIDVFA